MKIPTPTKIKVSHAYNAYFQNPCRAEKVFLSITVSAEADNPIPKDTNARIPET